MAMVESTSSLPGQLRKHGAVSVPYEKLAALIGLVFLQKTALNLQVCVMFSGPSIASHATCVPCMCTLVCTGQSNQSPCNLH